MAYYVVCNEHTNEITTDSTRFNDLLTKKTCHKKFNSKTAALHFLRIYNKYASVQYNAFIDMEFTCAQTLREFQYPEIHNEVLSIGIAITDNSGKIIDTFYSTVKPKYNCKLTKFCKELTHLTQNEINDSEELPKVLMRCIDFVKAYNITNLYSFGTSDFLQAKKNIEYFQGYHQYAKLKKFVNKITDIQHEISGCLIGRKLEISLEDAKVLCGISGEVKHNALSDAKDLSRILFATFYNPPSNKKVKRYNTLRDNKIKYNQLRRFKSYQADFDTNGKDQIKSICKLLEDNCDIGNIAIQSLIDDLLFVSKQTTKFY